MNDILMQIRSDLPSFSKGQKRIANYILESYDKAAFMTASRLGKMVEVSESTVVRFAVELGFDGYPSMQKTLQELVRNKLTSVQRIEVTNDRLGNQDVVSTVLQGDIDSIRMTSEALSRSEMAASVQAMLKAKTIYIVGVRSSASLAAFLNFYLRNGFRYGGYDCALFGVHYRALIRGAEDVTAEELLQVHQSIYRRHFPPALYQRFMQIPLRPGERPNPPGRWMEEEKDGVSQ